MRSLVITLSMLLFLTQSCFFCETSFGIYEVNEIRVKKLKTTLHNHFDNAPEEPNTYIPDTLHVTSEDTVSYDNLIIQLSFKQELRTSKTAHEVIYSLIPSVHACTPTDDIFTSRIEDIQIHDTHKNFLEITNKLLFRHSEFTDYPVGYQLISGWSFSQGQSLLLSMSTPPPQTHKIQWQLDIKFDTDEVARTLLVNGPYVSH